jgi:hypothetical protein
MDSISGTGIFADSTADTAHIADFLRRFAFVLIRAFHYNVIRTFMEMNNLAGASLDTFAAGNAFFFIHLGNTDFIDPDRLEFAALHAGTTADTAVFTAGILLCPAASVTGHQSRTIGKLLF